MRSQEGQFRCNSSNRKIIRIIGLNPTLDCKVIFQTSSYNRQKYLRSLRDRKRKAKLNIEDIETDEQLERMDDEGRCQEK